MGSGSSSWRFVLFLLLVLMCGQDSIARKLTIWKHDQQAEASDGHQRIYGVRDHDSGYVSVTKHDHADVHPHPSSHMDHIEPTERVFFTIDDLRIGKSIPIYFSYKDPATSPHLLSRDEANSIPFSSAQLPYLLQLFSFSKDSPQAKAMNYTITECELQPIDGETKFCATSLESMLDFARGIFGLVADFKVLTTTFITKPLAPLQNYTILGLPDQIFAPKMIACHSMPYPYAVFYCHYQESENKLFKISLSGENGERVEATAVCHMDTSQWNRDHAAFRVLKTEPGTSPACHFFPADNLVWVPEMPAST